MPSKIEWTDNTWNVCSGCSPISEGCANCYAKRMATRLKGRCGYPVDDPFRVTFHQDRLNQPLKWKKPKRIFVVSMGDLFHENVTDSQINSVFLTMVKADWHQYILLTKRPQRMLEFMSIGWRGEMPHVMVGVTAENQQRADERIPILLQIPAAKRFVSVEPMLEKIDLAEYMPKYNYLLTYEYYRSFYSIKVNKEAVLERSGIDWVICGGETGPGARPMESDWARSLRDQCKEAGVSFFFKKHGDWWCKQFGVTPKYRENHELDGQIHEEWPE
jgi:protein gp37